MVQKIKIGQITEDGVQLTQVITGKILKVYVRTNKPTAAVIEIVTTEQETFINKKLENTDHIMYPFNDIIRITPETPRQDYFYSDGQLGIKITNLQKGEIIEAIRIFIE